MPQEIKKTGDVYCTEEQFNELKEQGKLVAGTVYHTDKIISKRNIEQFTISTWTELADSSPFTYSATVTATTTIGETTNVELINDQAILFANYGFNILSINGQDITIGSIGQPTKTVNLSVEIGG